MDSCTSEAAEASLQWPPALVWVLFAGVVGCIAYGVFMDMDDLGATPVTTTVRAEAGQRCCE